MISIECLKRETRSVSQYLPATGEATREQRHGLGHGDLVTFLFLFSLILYVSCMYIFWKLFTIKPFFSLFLFIKSDNIINHRIGKGKKNLQKKKVQVHKNYSIYIYLHFVNYLIIRNIPKKKN